MKEKLPTSGTNSATEREQVTFSLPLYELKDLSSDSIRSTFPCEGSYIAELPDKFLFMVNVNSLQDGYYETIQLPVSLIIERAVAATKQHLLDAYIRNMANAIDALETKLDALANHHETLHDTVQENFKTVHLNHNEDFNDYRERLESARQELKDAVDHLHRVLSVSSNNKTGISEEGLIKIIDSVRK